MKTIPPPCPEPEIGPKYWRSLEQLSDTAEFRHWMEREFPAGASELTDPVTRRNFVKVMSASFLLAGLGVTGCRRPVEKIYPFAKMPENYTYGVAQYFATAMPSRRGAVPLVVKSNEGRPTKVEGNPDHPDSNGGTDAITQASLLSLYDPDRAMHVKRNGVNQSRSAALDFLQSVGREAGDGTGVAFLLEASSSPSRDRLRKALSEKLPNAKWHTYEPIDLDLGRQAAVRAYNSSVEPYYKLEEAKVIVSIDCDFIGNEQGAHGLIRRFAKGRALDSKDDSMSRLYTVESLFTLTGMSADHRLRVPPSMIVSVMARLALNVLKESASTEKLRELAAPAQAHDSWIIPCAADLKANAGKSLVMAGYRLPLGAHVLAIAINEALGAVGHTVEFRQASSSQDGTLVELAALLNGGQVRTLVILGGNPGYNAPVDLNWPQAQAKAKTVIRLGFEPDETSWDTGTHAETQWDLPMAHYLESWGDARTADGTIVPIQPLIDPLFGGITDLEVLALLGGISPSSPYEVVRETFRSVGGASENDWGKFLHDGFLANTASPVASAQFDDSKLSPALSELKAPAGAPSKDHLEVVFFRDAKMDDGRHSNNGWLQELPDPITKITWDNAILLSPTTAKDLGVYTERNGQNQKFFDLTVTVTLNGRTIKGPVWVQPGMADNTLGMALGYGREKTGRVGQGAGFNAYKLRASDNLFYSTGATLQNTGDRSYELAVTQSHWSMEGRPVIREANFEEYQKNPKFADQMKPEEPPVVEPMYPNPLDTTRTKAVNQWGMSIDLNRCVGCSACMVACQSENNVPIVGKEMVGKSREMHWIRLDRYYAGPPENPQAVAQPMLCQHCEAAPCENVCPVNATSHDDEGLNVMTYNRCVGTRYCSNNCPYKVRRFNFFDYNRRPLNHLYKSPLITVTDGEYELLRWLKNPDKGNLPEDQWQLTRMVKNPDVSVRMRGVMEKCSLCLQRIEQAKIRVKVQARDSDHVRLSETEGTVPKTACQQACPAEAIVFGDISDPESRVSKAKAQDRTYKVLDFLLTKPRCTYLARVRNPNPMMPDYKEHSMPYSEKDYLDSKGDAPDAGQRTFSARERSPVMATALDKNSAVKIQPPPTALEREPLVGHQRSIGWLSDRIASVIEGETPGWWKISFLISTSMMTLCFSMILYLMSTGVGIWGLQHPVMWGWAIINFVWWIGIGHAGTLISAILFLLRQRWRTSINRAAEAMTIFAVMCAGIFPLIHIGRIWLGWWLFPIPNSNGIWPQFRSPLMWDVFAVSTYFTVSVLFWYMGLIPDLAVMRDRAKTKIRKFSYGLFALGWTGSNRHWSNYEKAYLILAGLSTPLVLSVHSIVSLDFAVSQLPGWHTTIFPPYFVAGAVYSGFGMVLTLLVPLRRMLKLEDIITVRHVELMCKVTLATGSIVGYAYGMEFFIAWYSGNPVERFLFLHNRAADPFILGPLFHIQPAPYWWGFWTMVICNVVVPQCFWFKKVRTSMLTVFALSILVNIGMWFERFVIVVTSLHREFIPSNWNYYSPTWIDVLQFLGTFGLFFTFFLLFLRYVPLIAIAEVKGVTPQADPHHPLGGAKIGEKH